MATKLRDRSVSWERDDFKRPDGVVMECYKVRYRNWHLTVQCETDSDGENGSWMYITRWPDFHAGPHGAAFDKHDAMNIACRVVRNQTRGR